MSFARLTRGDWIAWGAALVLLLSLSVDWYSTVQGDEARRIEGLAESSGGLAGQVERDVREDARIVAEGAERNAFQEGGALDRLILVVLLASAGLAFAAGALRAAGRRYEPPRTPSAAAALAAAAGGLLVTYRIAQEPGLDAGTTVKVGALLGLVSAGALALGAASALRAEQRGTAWAEPDAPVPEGEARAA